MLKDTAAKARHFPAQEQDTRPAPFDVPPGHRLRRLRKSGTMRDLMQECRVSVSDLIAPLFVEENTSERSPIASLPGQFRESESTLPSTMQSLAGLGLKAVMLFGVSHNKDAAGSDSFNRNGLPARMIRSAKDAAPEVLVIADLCFCEYTDHGHCGPIGANSDVDNDRTLENLQKQAVTLAEAGADIIAPSGMMDGMVVALRSALDQNGFIDIPIMSYAAKFASCFYGPFRDAAGCSLENAPAGLPRHRKSYQMNPANRLETLREVENDIREGADMVMIKPGMPYLDIIREVKDRFEMPTFAYQVSGEYAMMKAASMQGWLSYEEALAESLLCFKRAGCDGIFTYGAADMAKIIAKS